MAKATVKFFRDPLNAEKAAQELRSKGFKADEIGILVRDKEKAERLGTGATEEIGAALANLLDLPEETLKYYEFGVSVGGVLISVHTDEARLPQARKILREADVGVAPSKGEMWASSPAFPAAGRMTQTDPIDAKMTGDFRRY
ncbi:MAG: hypothetical protein IBX36_04615 [Dehalococcoidia bacterium]|nr:hypothetical protein [Dehalococcoidia bacterium]